MSINMDSIMKKAVAYSKSPAGQQKMREYIKDCVEHGRTKTASGQPIVSEKRVAEATAKFIEVLRMTTQGNAQYSIETIGYDTGFPDSVMRHIDDLRSSKLIHKGDHYEVLLWFDGDLSRKSLMPEKYGGVENIVALINNGYDKNENIGKVWGEWHGCRIHGLTEREGLHFIQQAVSDFNCNYGFAHHVEAVAGTTYD